MADTAIVEHTELALASVVRDRALLYDSLVLVLAFGPCFACSCDQKVLTCLLVSSRRSFYIVVRFADYVAAGCIGPEPREWPDSADPWVERTHRRWCPLEYEHPGWRNAYVPQAHPHPGRCWCNLCIPGKPMIARVWYARSLYRSL